MSVTAKELVHVEEANLLPAANTRDNDEVRKKKSEKDQPADKRTRLQGRESREDSRPYKFKKDIVKVIYMVDLERVL